jgi:hypothetical protein
MAKEPAEAIPDQSGAALLEVFESLRRLAHIAEKRRLQFFQFTLQTAQEIVQGAGEMVRRASGDLLEGGANPLEFVPQHRLEKCLLAREMDVESFLAHGQLGGQIVHRHVAKTMLKEVSAGRLEDPPARRP